MRESESNTQGLMRTRTGFVCKEHGFEQRCHVSSGDVLAKHGLNVPADLWHSEVRKARWSVAMLRLLFIVAVPVTRVGSSCL